MEIKTQSFKQNNKGEDHTLNIIDLVGDTETSVAHEIMLQAKNLGTIKEASLNGYITPRDLNEALWEVRQNLYQLAQHLDAVNNTHTPVL